MSKEESISSIPHVAADTKEVDVAAQVAAGSSQETISEQDNIRIRYCHFAPNRARLTFIQEEDR